MDHLCEGQWCSVKGERFNQVWLVTPAVRRWEDQEFKTILDSNTRTGLTWATRHPVSKRQKKRDDRLVLKGN